MRAASAGVVAVPRALAAVLLAAPARLLPVAAGADAAECVHVARHAAIVDPDDGDEAAPDVSEGGAAPVDGDARAPVGPDAPDRAVERAQLEPLRADCLYDPALVARPVVAVARERGGRDRKDREQRAEEG